MPVVHAPLTASAHTQDAPRVLVVDDEENIAYLVASGLRTSGCAVSTAGTGEEAVDTARTFHPQVVVLDVMLPDRDGYEVLSNLRADGCDAPVLFLTARHETAERVRGLTCGGDDYIVKPFALEEVVARVHLALRRGKATATRPGRLQVHDLVLDEDAWRVWRAGQEIHLTATEFALLRCLMANKNRVVPRAQILDHVWKYDFAGESGIIESFISSLRKKLDRGPVRLIHTVRGMGYSVREPA